MKLALALVLALGAVSSAGIVKAPAGWTGGANAELVTRTGGEGHFGGVHGIVEAERYDAPKPGVVLYATRIAVTTSAREAAANAEITALHRTGEVDWQQAITDKALLVVMTWKDEGVHGEVHEVVAGSGDAVLVAAKAECVAADDAAKEDVAACVEAAKTVDPAIAVDNRMALRFGAPPSPSPSTSTMNDGTNVPVPPPTQRRDETPPTDRRPMYVAAGVILLGTAFWWNRRRRERFEREEKPQ